MPIHDWTRVIPAIFHHFHHDWLTTLKRSLNGGVLPKEYYALAEQITSGVGPDLLTLESSSKVRSRAFSEIDLLTLRKNRIAIHHNSDHRVVAVIEMVSPGNKSSRQALQAFVENALAFLDHGVHLLVIDLFPPSPRDPQGIHAAIWTEFADDEFA
jgi:hypothetical protein